MEDEVRYTRRELLAGGALLIGGSLLVARRALRDTIPWRSESVDVNAASPDQLRAVPGIGTSTAAAIVSQRPFRSLEELEPLLGRARLGRARPWLRLPEQR